MSNTYLVTITEVYAIEASDQIDAMDRASLYGRLIDGEIMAERDL